MDYRNVLNSNMGNLHIDLQAGRGVKPSLFFLEQQKILADAQAKSDEAIQKLYRHDCFYYYIFFAVGHSGRSRKTLSKMERWPAVGTM